MLNIIFGNCPEAIYNTSVYFNNVFLDNWMKDDFTQKIIKSVDKGTVLGPRAVDTKALGVIPTEKLSGGTKTLILIDQMPQKIFNASTCGDNCAKWLLRIAKKHKEDITVNLHHIMDFGDKDFEMRILNSGEIVHNMGEFIDAAVENLRPEVTT